MFQTLDMKSDTSDPEATKQWVLDYLKTQGKKTESGRTILTCKSSFIEDFLLFR